MTELLILGLGNTLCADDGAGVSAADRLAAAYECPPGVEIVDGGTLGLALLPLLRSARQVILLDAVRAGNAPGTVIELDGARVAPAVEAQLSPHQVGVADLLNGASLLGGWPERVHLIGVEPQAITLGWGLNPPVMRAIPEMIRRAVQSAKELGFELRPRPRISKVGAEAV